jgi:nucleoid DNA-binding protein
MISTIEEAIAAYVRERLMRKESAELPGIGTFGVVHEKAADEKTGKTSKNRKPPKDVIQFTPEAQI